MTMGSPLRKVPPWTDSGGIVTHSLLVRNLTMCGLVVAGVLAFAAGANAAKPKPYWWTGGQAAKALVAANPEIRPYLTDTIFLNVGSANCYGQGKRIGKTFQQFRCVTLFKTDGSTPRYFRGVVFAKVRKQGAGELCVSSGSLAAVPAGCLVSGARAAGSAREAKVYVQRLPEAHPFNVACVGNGAGFYSCSWVDQDGGQHSASVTFTPTRPIVRLLS